MATDLMDSTNSINISNFVPFIGENYDLKLKQSIQDFLAEIRQEAPNFSVYVDTFYQLIQAKVDPPFEAIWVYAALNFRSRNCADGDTLDRISVAKDLLQLLSVCSASSGASKCIALLVFIVFEVYKVFLEWFPKESSMKREKKAMREAKSLLDSVLGYISVCCSNNSQEECDSLCPNLMIPFTDLVCFWVSPNEELESFLPLLSSDACRWLCTRDSIIGYLAGAVIMQSFFLKLCLNVHLAKPRDELENNLKSWAVSSISSIRNVYFFEILMRTALETHLPLSSILKPEDELLLRRVLFDAILLVDYPFLYLNAKHINSLTLPRLILTHEAVEYFRGCEDHNRAISYVKAFSASRLPLQIIKCVTNQNHLEEKENGANGSSPGALLKWLLSLEEAKGIKVFEDDVLKSCAKQCLGISQVERPEANLEGKVADDYIFYVDNMREEGNTCEEDEQNKLASAAFVAAAQTMKVTDNGKRKQKSASTKKKIKFVKYDVHPSPNPVNAGTSVAKDSSSGESEVEGPASDTE